MTVNDDNITTTIVVTFDRMIYNEQIKQCIRDDESLMIIIRSLHNIVWVQCSRLMKYKVIMAKLFKTIEKEGG